MALWSVADRRGARKVRKSCLVPHTICDPVGRVAAIQILLNCIYTGAKQSKNRADYCKRKGRLRWVLRNLSVESESCGVNLTHLTLQICFRGFPLQGADPALRFEIRMARIRICRESWNAAQGWLRRSQGRFWLLRHMLINISDVARSKMGGRHYRSANVLLIADPCTVISVSGMQL